MDDQRRAIDRALDFLQAHYPDPRANSNKSIGGTAKESRIISGVSYTRIGMKQSKIHYTEFVSCKFDSTAMTGSQFRCVKFRGTTLVGSGFACCDFYDTEFDGKQCPSFSANNFSLSSFENCRFSGLQFANSGMLNSLYHNCCFENVLFKSSTLEGTSFVNCQIRSCDFSSTNVEFTRFAKTALSYVKFPFYQFPYVIGAADHITMPWSTVKLQADNITVPMAEYKEQIDRLILYYLDKHEYFPMCNLAIAKNDLKEARKYLLDGITTALQGHNRDFRMVRYFCQLALHHNILDEVTRHRILQNMDEFLLQKEIPESQLNYYMTYVGNIRTLLHGGSSQAVTLRLNIKTNVHRDDADGVEFVNGLMSELNESLSQAEGKDGFRVSVSNYSPYEIVIEVLSAIGSVASLASLIWMVIDKISQAKRQKECQRVDLDVYRDYIGAKIDCMRADLLRLQETYSKRKFSKYITEITQQLKTELEELYSKDIMIFKLKNDSASKKE